MTNPLLAYANTLLIMSRGLHRSHLPLNNKSNGTGDSDLDSIFDIGDNKADTVSNTDIGQFLEVFDSDINNDDDLSRGKYDIPLNIILLHNTISR